MDLFESNDYRLLIRERVKKLRRERPGLTLRSLSERLPMQYTYLSRALRNEAVHLGEDDLFTLCRLLDFAPDEIDYVVTLRARSVAKSGPRREHLEKRINSMRSTRQLAATAQSFRSDRLSIDTSYLFDPLAAIVHVALYIPEYAANPKRLCAPLGIPSKRLDRIVQILVDADYAEKAKDGAIVPRRGAMHYGPDHPLTRAHQSLCKNLGNSRVQQTDEKDKTCFLSTFAADEEAFRAIEERFRAFLRDAEAIARKARPRATYQLSFDLFRWL